MRNSHSRPAVLATAAAWLLVSAPLFATPPPSVVNVPSRSTVENPANRLDTRGAQLAAGTRIATRLDTTIDSHRARPGEPFTARVESPVLDNAGNVVIPVGAQLVGTVRGADQNMWTAAHVQLAIDGVRIGSRFVPLAANIVESQANQFRAGARLRNYIRLDAGSPLVVQTVAPVALETLRGTGERGVGGGPGASAAPR